MAQNTIAQLEEPEREEERPEEREERALEPVEATTPAGTSPAPVDPVLSRHSESEVEAVRNGADSVDPKLAPAIRQKDAFDAIASGGLKVTKNPLGPNQEANVTITSPYEPGVKLNLRVETHPLTPGGPPVRHVNVERIEPGLKNRPVVVSNTHIDQ